MGYEVRAHIGTIELGDNNEFRSLLEIAMVDMCVASHEFNAVIKDGDRIPIRLFSNIGDDKFVREDSYGDSMVIVDPEMLLKGIKKSKYRRDKILAATLKAVIADFPGNVKDGTLKVVARHY